MTNDKRVRVRLLRVTVEAEFVIDDGSTLRPLPVETAQFSAADWSEFAADNFEKAIADLERGYNS